MCKDILEDKTLNVEEMMNNLNSLPVPAPTPLTVAPEPGAGVTANGGPHRLPEKVRGFTSHQRWAESSYFLLFANKCLLIVANQSICCSESVFKCLQAIP